MKLRLSGFPLSLFSWWELRLISIGELRYVARFFEINPSKMEWPPEEKTGFLWWLMMKMFLGKTSEEAGKWN